MLCCVVPQVHSDVWAFLLREVRPSGGHKAIEQVLCSLQLLATAIERLDFALPSATASRCITVISSLLDSPCAENDKLLAWTIRALQACTAAFPALFPPVTVRLVRLLMCGMVHNVV